LSIVTLFEKCVPYPEVRPETMAIKGAKINRKSRCCGQANKFYVRPLHAVCLCLRNQNRRKEFVKGRETNVTRHCKTSRRRSSMSRHKNWCLGYISWGLG